MHRTQLKTPYAIHSNAAGSAEHHHLMDGHATYYVGDFEGTLACAGTGRQALCGVAVRGGGGGGVLWPS